MGCSRVTSACVVIDMMVPKYKLEEEEEVEEEMEEEGLVPGKQVREMEEQNKVLWALLEDPTNAPPRSLQGTPVVSETSKSVLTTLLPLDTNSSPSLETEGQRGESTEDLVAMEPSLYKALKLNLALQQKFQTAIARIREAIEENLRNQSKMTEELGEDEQYTHSNLGTSAGLPLPSSGLSGPHRSTHTRRREESSKVPFRYSNLCVPYFKDSSGMSAPMNEDAKYKVEHGFLDLYTTRIRPWCSTEHKDLQKAVHQEWKEIRKSECGTKLLELQRQLKASKGNSILEEKVAMAEAELAKISNIPPEDLIPPCHAKLDWEKVAAQAFDTYRTSDECQLQWENVLHPSINHSPWTDKEDLQIQQLVLKSKKNPNWEAIAKRLNNERTAYMVMKRWVTFIHPTLNPAAWTPEDTQKLIDTVALLRTGMHIPWTKVQQHLPRYTRQQIYTRWQVVNPAALRGHFTVEEDFILIKGLYLFGFDFTNITHFMPGRTQAQVRDRFRRAILPSLVYRPWTRKEDDVLIRKGQVGRHNWKKMSWDLPRHNACEIRCRYHTLQVWQTLTESNMVPPPLFPLTLTTDESQIRMIRNMLLMNACAVKDAIHQSRKGLDMKSVIKELEERRLAITARKAKTVAKKQVVETRGRPRGIPTLIKHDIQDLLFNTFFAPGRTPPPDYYCTAEGVMSSLRCLSRTLQLHLRSDTEPPASGWAQLGQSDWDMVQELTQSSRSRGQQQTGTGEASSSTRPINMPLLPPSQTTLGAMLSLLLHLPKLKEMASNTFLFQKFTPKELAKLGTNQDPAKLLQPSLKSVSDQQQDESGAEGGSSSLPHTSASPSLCSSSGYSVRESEAGPSELPPGTLSHEESGGESEATTESRNSGGEAKSTSLQFHITSLGKQKRPKAWLKQGMKAATLNTYMRSGAVDPKGVDQPSARTQETQVPQEPPSTLPQQGTETTEASEAQEAEREAREKADQLLFQRMLSIFFFPTLMTKEEPPSKQVEAVETATKSSTEEEPQEKHSKGQKRGKQKVNVDTMDTEEMEEYIENLSEQHQRLLEKVFPHRFKQQHPDPPQPPSSTGDKGHPEEAKSAQEEGEAEAAFQQDEAKKKTCRRGRKRGREADLRGDMEERPAEAAPQPPTPPGDEGKELDSTLPRVVISATTHRHKQQIGKLKKSLAMKKIWEARRAGTRPPRTSHRDKRTYQPRPSRTRERTRETPPATDTPNPWDLPLSGPLKVEPQDLTS